MMGAKEKAVRGLTMGIAGLFKQNKVRPRVPRSPPAHPRR